MRRKINLLRPRDGRKESAITRQSAVIARDLQIPHRTGGRRRSGESVNIDSPARNEAFMDSIEFLAIISVFVGILAWYIHNVRSGSDGHAGLLALRQNADAPKPNPPGSRYRTTSRARNQIPGDGGKIESCGNHDRPSHRKFRQRDGPRYRIKDKAARYRPKKAGPPF